MCVCVCVCVAGGGEVIVTCWILHNCARHVFECECWHAPQHGHYTTEKCCSHALTCISISPGNTPWRFHLNTTLFGSIWLYRRKWVKNLIPSECTSEEILLCGLAKNLIPSQAPFYDRCYYSVINQCDICLTQLSFPSPSLSPSPSLPSLPSLQLLQVPLPRPRKPTSPCWERAPLKSKTNITTETILFSCQPIMKTKPAIVMEFGSEVPVWGPILAEEAAPNV